MNETERYLRREILLRALRLSKGEKTPALEDVRPLKRSDGQPRRDS